MGLGTGIKVAPRSLKLSGKEARGQSELGRGFTETLRTSILESLEDVLGKPALGALSAHFNMDRLAEDPTGLHDSLTEVFGNGAVVLEKLIAKELYQRLDLRLGGLLNNGFDFVGAIRDARDRRASDR